MIIITWREIKEKITQQQQKCMFIAFELNPHLERHLEKKEEIFEMSPKFQIVTF